VPKSRNTLEDTLPAMTKRVIAPAQLTLALE
jgi:hypothetical protein